MIATAIAEEDQGGEQTHTHTHIRLREFDQFLLPGGMVGALQNTARQRGSDTCPCEPCSVSKSLSPVRAKHHCGKKRAPSFRDEFRPPLSHTRNARSFLLSHLPPIHVPSRELARCMRFAILTTWLTFSRAKSESSSPELILPSSSRTPSVGGIPNK